MRILFILLMTVASYLTCITAAYAAPDFNTQLAYYLNSPDIVYFLLLFGIYCVFFEVANPGAFLPGIIGTISLLTALYAMQSLPVNYAGLSLILIGMTFIIMEFIMFSYGFLGITGLITFVLGSFVLFDATEHHHQLSLSLIVMMALLSIAFFAVVVTMAVRAHRKKVTTGKEGLVNAHGEVISISDHKIIIRVMGELWEAESSDKLKSGDTVIVKKVKDLVLTVVKEKI